MLLYWLVIGGLAIALLLALRRKTDSGLVYAIDTVDDEKSHIRGTTRVERKIAYMFQAKFGILSDRASNRLIAGEFVRKTMHEIGMRPTDIVRHMDVTIELCLIPTKYSLRAAELGRMDDVTGRRRAVAPKQ